MALQATETVAPLRMFVNETDDIVSAATQWNGTPDSDDSDDGSDAPISLNSKLSKDDNGKRMCPRPGKKTMGRVKIKMEYIKSKVRRYTTFSKRKTGMMKKAYELSVLTGTQVMLLVASETGHVYTFATRKLQPIITSDNGKALIQACLNTPDPSSSLNRLDTNQASVLQSTEALNKSQSTERVNQSENILATTASSTSEINSVVQVNSADLTSAGSTTSTVAASQAATTAANFANLEALMPTAIKNFMVVPGLKPAKSAAAQPLLVGSDVDSRHQESLTVSMVTDAKQQVAQIFPAVPAAQLMKQESPELLTQQQAVSHVYYSLPGTNQFISIPVESFKDGPSQPVEQQPVALVNVGEACPTQPAGPTLVYPQNLTGIVTSNSDGFLLSVPSAPALFAIAPEVGGTPQQFFTIPLPASQSQLFQSLAASTVAVTSVNGDQLKLVSSQTATDLT